MLESRLEVTHGASSALSPFNQQEVLTRLQQLEQRADLMEEQAKKLRQTAEEVRHVIANHLPTAGACHYADSSR